MEVVWNCNDRRREMVNMAGTVIDVRNSLTFPEAGAGVHRAACLNVNITQCT